MNAITDIEALVKQARTLQCPYFRVYVDKIEDRNKVRENWHVENMTIEETERQIREIVNDYAQSGCNLVFWFTDKTGNNASKGGFKVNFYQPARNGYNNAPGVGYLSKEEAIALQNEGIAKAMESFKTQMLLEKKEEEIKKLRQEIRELKPNSWQTRLSPIFEPPVFNAIVKKVFDVEVNNTMNTANISGTKENDTPNEEAQRIAEESLSFLAQDDPDFYETLRKLADLKRNNPDQYNFAKSFLK